MLANALVRSGNGGSSRDSRGCRKVGAGDGERQRDAETNKQGPGRAAGGGDGAAGEGDVEERAKRCWSPDWDLGWDSSVGGEAGEAGGAGRAIVVDPWCRFWGLAACSGEADRTRLRPSESTGQRSDGAVAARRAGQTVTRLHQCRVVNVKLARSLRCRWRLDVGVGVGRLDDVCRPGDRERRCTQ